SRYVRGALLVLAAGLMWSTTGAIMRLAPHLDTWQFLLYRCIGIVCAVGLLNYWRGRSHVIRKLVGLGPAGAVVTLSFCVSTAAFILAIKTTSVANALFLNSCSPIL